MILSITFLFILIANGLFECAARSVLLWAGMKSRKVSSSALPRRLLQDLAPELFISVHVPACNEPSDLVISTLRAIAVSDFKQYEVIVIDNNTADPAVWRPVKHEVQQLGSAFRFFHFDRLSGAKAGALNVALAHTNPLATHVAVIDADYRIAPTFFCDALHAAVSGKVDYVQFPQAYRRVSVCGRGVENELGDYFTCFAYGAGRTGSMLPTGTLSLFSIRALRAVGGWSEGTITEDAELGVRLQSAGYRGLWIAKHAGDGLLPVDFRGLAKQRARWAAGNMQVLLKVAIKRGSALGAVDTLILFAQLTAWISFWGLPAAALALVATFPGIPLARPIGVIAGGTILLSFLLTSIRIAMLAEKQASRWSVNLSALTTKLALTWTSAYSWIPTIAGVPLRFHRTPKTPSVGQKNTLPLMLLASALFGIFGLTFELYNRETEATACYLLATVWVCARSTDKRLRATAILNTAKA